MTRDIAARRFKRVVVKVGTSMLADSDGQFSLSILGQVVRQVKKILRDKREVVLVSSGAIGCGMKALGYRKRPKDLPALQACAAVGQGKLQKSYDDFFSKYRFRTAQILLTRDGFQDRIRCLNIRNTLQSLLRLGVIPIVNENDSVSTEEIRFGDNDTLSVSVAEIIGADLLVLLTDVDGVYMNGKGQTLVSEVNSVKAVDELFRHVFSHQKKVVTAGGMHSKLEVTKRAIRNGISVAVINGKNASGLIEFMAGKRVGTFFNATRSKRGFKKNWLSGIMKAHGNLTVDAGAHAAVVTGGKSLLSSGIREVTGSFRAGDSVQVSETDGRVFARGIVNYSSDELIRIKGKKTSEIVSVLGYKYKDEAIHRDNLVITE